MYIESYGCQMNFSDSEIVASILNQEGFASTPTWKMPMWCLSTLVPSEKKQSKPLEID